jgi:hypothetical protein
MKAGGLTADAVAERVTPIVSLELASIHAIDASRPLEPHPGYVTLFRETKRGKQANVAQLLTLVRMRGGVPSAGTGGVTGLFPQLETVISQTLGTARRLRAMLAAESEIVARYDEALRGLDGLEASSVQKARDRSRVHEHVLMAHVAKLTGNEDEARRLPHALSDYFAGADARVCMRCLLDRQGRNGALELADPHPYTYVCAGCHDEVAVEFAPDLADKMELWPPDVRRARIIQKALGRVSTLNAAHRVLRPLSGLPPEVPTPAAEAARERPAIQPTPGPDASAPRAQRMIDDDGAGVSERPYTDQLFDWARMRRHW